MKCKMMSLTTKLRNDTSQELTIRLSSSLFLKKIQTFSCGKIKSSLKELLKLTGKDSLSAICCKRQINEANPLSGYIVENGFVAKLFSMLNVDVDSQTVTKSTNR